MKGPVVLGLWLCILFAVCIADDEEKRQKIKKFLTCVACAAPDSDIRTEYKACSAHKPPRASWNVCMQRREATDEKLFANRYVTTFVKLLKDCCKKTMPDATDEDAVWEKICSDDSILDKMHKCVKSEKGDVEPTEEEKQQFMKYKECAMEINKKCH